MSGMGPGWVDQAAAQLKAALKDSDEKARSEALGLQPRRCFRVSRTAVQQSVKRGARLGRAKRPLPPLFEEDLEDGQ